MTQAHHRPWGPYQLETTPARLGRGEQAISLQPRTGTAVRYVAAHPSRLVTTTEARWWEAEGYRLQGVLRLPRPRPDLPQAEAYVQQALAVAHRPQASAVEAHAKEELRNRQIDCQNYAYEYGIDKPEIEQWKWPY